MAELHVKRWQAPFLIDDDQVHKFDRGSVVAVRDRPVYSRYDTATRRYDRMALATYLTGLIPTRSQRWTHLNGDLHDFRLENLMLVARTGSDLQRKAVSKATRTRNHALRRAPEARMIGVFKSKGWYYARISVPGAKTVRSLGRYRTAEEAGRAYDRARVAYGLPPVNFPE